MFSRLLRAIAGFKSAYLERLEPTVVQKSKANKRKLKKGWIREQKK